MLRILPLGILCAMLVIGPACARADGLNSFFAGLNGVLTFPADPILRTIDPPSELEELPLAPVSSHIGGLFTGVLLGGFRAITGALDIALTPLWVAPTLSPRPAIKIVPYDVDYPY